MYQVCLNILQEKLKKLKEEEICLQENGETMIKYLTELDSYAESLEKNILNVEKETETLGNKNLYKAIHQT